MTDLIDRYVHQVGRYLLPKERAEIEAELRSQIQDQLDDRFEGTPSQADVAAVLAEFGPPYRMAASYNRDQYLVGPELYSVMVLALRNVWVVVPTIVIFLNVFGALIASRQGMWLQFIVETVLAILQTTFSISAVVVLLFALAQRVSAERGEKEPAFDPLKLPKADDPASADFFEVVSGSAIGTVVALLLLYWLAVGGMTLHFDLSNPGAVIAVPLSWLALLTAAVVGQVIMHLLVLRRGRWSVGLYLTQTVLEVFGVICLYFAILTPLFERIVADNPALAGTLGGAPQAIAVGFGLLTLVSRGIKQVRLWHILRSGTAPVNVPTHR